MTITKDDQIRLKNDPVEIKQEDFSRRWEE